MPYFFVFLVAPIAVAIALYRRNPRRFLDGPSEDAPLRLLRWAVSLLSPQRAEWGQAMLGELGHLDGRWRRTRFALGCTGAALILPPWGRAAAGLWATIGATAASLIIYASMTVHYGLGVGGWIALAVVRTHLRRVPARCQRPAAPTRYRAARPARRPVRDPGRTRAVRVHPDRPGHLHPRSAGTAESPSSSYPPPSAPPAPCGAATRSRAGASPAWPPSAADCCNCCTPPSRSPSSAPADPPSRRRLHRHRYGQRPPRQQHRPPRGRHADHRDGRLGRRRPRRLPGTPSARTGRAGPPTHCRGREPDDSHRSQKSTNQQRRSRDGAGWYA